MWPRSGPDMAIAAIAVAAHRLREPLASGDPALADMAVRLAANGGNSPRLGPAGPVVPAIIKFVIAIPLAILIWFDFYLIWSIITGEN